MNPPTLPQKRALAPTRELPSSPHKHKGIPAAFAAALGPPRPAAPAAGPSNASGPGVGPVPAGVMSRRPEAPAEAPVDPARPASAPIDLLDSMARVLAVPLSHSSVVSSPAAAPSAAPLTPDEVLLDRVLKRLSWGGNGKRGTARIELCGGSLAGATLVLHADGRELTLEAEGVGAAALEQFAANLSRRLLDKGIVLRASSQG